MNTVQTAWDLIGYDGPLWLRIVGGRTLYDTATFYDHTPGEKVKLSRIDTTGGLRQVDRWVDADTLVELVQA